MLELKPCPACGSKIAAPALEHDVEFPQLGYVRCRSITCGLRTGLFADGGRHAVEIWNSLPRHDEVRGVGEWIVLEPEIDLRCCSICDHKIIRADCNYCPNCGAKMGVNE